jgi:hypothetical protein
VNGSLVKETQCKPYSSDAEYDENSVGCGIVTTAAGQRDAETLKNNFKGEIGALYFVEVGPKTVAATHALLSKISSTMIIHDIFPLVCYGASSYESCPELKQAVSHKELVEGGLAERAFFIVNPKYSTSWTSKGDKIYGRKAAKSGHDLSNHIEGLYPQTQVHHNTPARDVMLDIQGINALLPLLYSFGEPSISLEKSAHAYNWNASNFYLGTL